jgi:hypothetical protein
MQLSRRYSRTLPGTMRKAEFDGNERTGSRTAGIEAKEMRYRKALPKRHHDTSTISTQDPQVSSRGCA